MQILVLWESGCGFVLKCPSLSYYQSIGENMIKVVAFLIEHFPDSHSCPAVEDLGMMLEQAGFEDEEIGVTLLFMQLLNEADSTEIRAPLDARAMRIYSRDETEALSTEIRSLIYFLEQENAVSPQQREFIIHALMHLPADEISTEHAKVLALLALWAHRSELPVLIGDELMSVLHGNGTMQ